MSDPRGPDNLAWACCGRWAADRGRFALYSEDAGGETAAWTFWDIQREANRFSNVLAATGVMRGDRVAVAAAARPETACVLLACWQMGAVAVILPGGIGAESLAARLADGTRVAVADASALAALEAARPQLPALRHVIGIGGAKGAGLRPWSALREHASSAYVPLDGCATLPAVEFGAAGSSAAGGVAKASASEASASKDAAPVSQGELLALARNHAAEHAGYPQEGDLLWSPRPWTDAEGLAGGLLAAWAWGQPALACAGEFDAESAVRLIDKYDVRNVRLTAAQLQAMMRAVPKPKEKHDCRLRTVAGGGVLEAPLADWLAEMGVTGSPGAAAKESSAS